MKKLFYPIGFLLLLAAMASCGRTQKEEPTEAVLEEKDMTGEEEMEQQTFSTVVDGRLEVTMESVGMAEDTVASMISGYIDYRNAPVKPGEMKLLLQTTAQGSKTRQYTMHIEEDGRVPGTWVAENSDCYFTLIADRDTFRFNTNVQTALYRFKMQFRAKA